MILEIKNLSIEIEKKIIIENLNMKFEKGKIYALMGKNGSGKSTLANVLMGNPKYRILSGKIFLDGKDITNLSPTEKAKEGIFMSFQLPQEIEGVTIFDFLRTAYNSLNGKKLSLLQFQRLAKEKCEILGLEENFLYRYLNKGFSGGEKKKSEILQLLILNPKIIILDETDSGLDIDALQIIAHSINSLKNENKIIIIISHYKRIFNYLNPDKVFIIYKNILIQGGNKIIDKLEKEGYSWIKND